MTTDSINLYRSDSSESDSDYLNCFTCTLPTGKERSRSQICSNGKCVGVICQICAEINIINKLRDECIFCQEKFITVSPDLFRKKAFVERDVQSLMSRKALLTLILIEQYKDQNIHSPTKEKMSNYLEILNSSDFDYKNREELWINYVDYLGEIEKKNEIELFEYMNARKILLVTTGIDYIPDTTECCAIL